MSIQETNFIKWFGGISATLILSFIIGGVAMFRAVGIIGNDVQHNELQIQALTDDCTDDINKLKTYHKDDVMLIREDIKDIKADQAEMKRDIKKILEKL